MMETVSPILYQATVLDLIPYSSGQLPERYMLRLSLPNWKDWKPGQFVMIRKTGFDSSVLWARPFSICRVTSNYVSIFFQVVGRVTEELANLKVGNNLDLWGPLGNPLPVEASKPTLLLAGGMGIAPFIAYTEAHPNRLNLSMFFAHRRPLSCYPFRYIRNNITAESYHEKFFDDLDTTIAILQEKITSHVKNTSGKGLVLACGPTPFLHTIQTISLNTGARTQLCLETKMACGIGACLGCVVKTMPETQEKNLEKQNESEQGHFVQTCTCGPNFWAKDIIL